MAISEKKIFEIMFSGLGTCIGIDLSNPKEELSNLLKTEFSEEHQETIRKICEKILNEKDYSFIPLPGTKEQEQFSQKWEDAYRNKLEEYKKLTEDIFAATTRGSTFEKQHITNRLEYKRLIQKITRMHPQCYIKEILGFEERFERFEQNSPNTRELEGMSMNMNMLYRIPKDSKACPIDAFAMRIKSCRRISQKIARKWVTLIDKIETSRIEGKPFKATYNDLLITDIFGFLMLENNNRNKTKPFSDDIIYVNGDIKTIEDSDKKQQYQTKLTHGTKGQRQLKLINTKTGTIYDYHLFRTLTDWIDNEFSRKTTDPAAEKKPHEDYMKEKLRNVLKKDPAYQNIYDEIQARAFIALNQCCHEQITETIYQKYTRSLPAEKARFLEEEQKKLERKIEELRQAGKEIKRKKVGVATARTTLTEIIKCYNEEIRKPLNDFPETCDKETYRQIREETVRKMYLAKKTIKQYEETTKEKFNTKEAAELVKSYMDITRVCELNREIQERYDNQKQKAKTNFKEKEAIDTINKLRTSLQEFQEEKNGEEPAYLITEYNLYKYLINSQKLFFDLSHNPNDYANQGITITKWQELTQKFIQFTEKNYEKLGCTRTAEAYNTVEDKKNY